MVDLAFMSGFVDERAGEWSRSRGEVEQEIRKLAEEIAEGRGRLRTSSADGQVNAGGSWSPRSGSRTSRVSGMTETERYDAMLRERI